MEQGTSTQDQATRDQATRDQDPQDQATRDQATRDQATRDQATRDAMVRAATPEPMPRRRLRSVRFRRLVPAGGDDVGMATAEYALVTVAAAGFAGLMMVILRGPEVKALLLGIIRGALSV